MQIFAITADGDIESALRENLVFFSDNEDTCLMVSDEYFAKMMLGIPDATIEWSNCTLFIRVSRAFLHPTFGPIDRAHYYNESPENFDKLFQRFPLFASEYALEGTGVLKTYMKQLFDNNQTLLPAIFTAMDSTRSSSKLVGAENERILFQYITPLIQCRIARADEELRSVQMTTNLTPAALNMIFQVFKYPPEQVRHRQIALFCLAFVFTALSSTSMLGTSGDSPEPIRIFAVALFNALTPNPAVGITPEQIQDWKRRLLGAEGQFSCSGILSNTLNRQIIANIRRTEIDPSVLAVLDDILPPAWRETADYD